MSLAASLRKELIELWRTRRLLVLLVVLVFFGMGSPLLAYFTPQMMSLIPGGEAFKDLIPPPTMLDAVGQYIKNTTQFGVVLALLLAMGVVVQEKERGTAAMMLVKPLPRGAFLLAKFVALALAFLVGLALAGAGGYFYTLVLFGVPDAGAWLAMNALLWLYLLVFVALTLLFSTLVRSPAAAAGLGFGALLLLSLIGLIQGMRPFLPEALVNWAAAGFTGGEPAWAAVAVSLGLVLGSLLAAWAVFRRQEI